MKDIFNQEFIYSFNVRGNELDSFGHVNNANYLNYLEQARWEIMRELKILDHINKTGGFLIVSDIQIRYVNELKIFDKCEVYTKMEQEGFFLIFKHRIKREETNIARSKVKCLFVGSDRKPSDLPEEIKKYITENGNKR